MNSRYLIANIITGHVKIPGYTTCDVISYVLVLISSEIARLDSRMETILSSMENSLFTSFSKYEEECARLATQCSSRCEAILKEKENEGLNESPEKQAELQEDASAICELFKGILDEALEAEYRTCDQVIKRITKKTYEERSTLREAFRRLINLQELCLDHLSMI